MLAAMGQGGRLVARTEADAAVPALAHLPSVGTHMRPNPELVAGLRPDLALVLHGRHEASQQADHLRQLGIQVAGFSMDSFEELFVVLRSLGQLAGARLEAEKLEHALRARLDAVARQVEGKARPSVFFEARYPNLLGAGRASIVSDIIVHAGGRNAVELDTRLVRLNEEELLRLNPDVYLVQRGPMNPADILPGQRPHFAPLKAVREGRVLVVDERLFSRPGPASLDAVEELAAYLHRRSLP
jgi:iron complex transport system substrate-binding protein